MRITCLFSLVFLIFLVGCGADDEIVCNDPVGNLADIPYDPVAYEFGDLPYGFPDPVPSPTDNPITVDGVNLGRHLFYDPILSVDSTTSCGSCHMPAGGFTDNKKVSEGVASAMGTRSSMSLINSAFYINGLFWDKRVQTLEEQALLPVENELELNHQWGDVEEDLKAHSNYPLLFRKAFGITNKSQITKELAAKAIAQFERSIVSAGNSKYDLAITNQDFLSPEEQSGHDIFFKENGSTHPGCFHCHNKPLFTTNEYFNNALDSVETLYDFLDPGLGGITGDEFDYGKFRAPTLRNIEYTAPYMHDGRFETLEEVIDHYDSGGHFEENVDVHIVQLGLTAEEKSDLLAFLLSLSDTTTLQNPAYQSPF